MLHKLVHKTIAWWAQKSWILSLMLLIAVPVLWAIVYSFAFSFGAIGRLSTGWTLEYWRSAIFDGFITRTVSYSVYVASCVTCLVIGTSLVVAGLFSEIRHSRWLLGMLLIQSGTPAVVVATQISHWGGRWTRFTHCFSNRLDPIAQ